MTNHVHLLMTPTDKKGVSLLIAVFWVVIMFDMLMIRTIDLELYEKGGLSLL